MSKRIIDYDSAHAALYKFRTLIVGSFPKLDAQDPADEYALALLGEVPVVDEQRVWYILRDLAEYARTSEWDGEVNGLRNYDGFEYHGGFNGAQRSAWCAEADKSLWRKCFNGLNPALTAFVNDAVACVAQDVVAVVIQTFNTKHGLAMWNYQMAAVRRNSEEMLQLRTADRKLFLYPQLKRLLVKRGFNVRE